MLSKHPDNSNARGSWAPLKTFELEKHLIMLGQNIDRSISSYVSCHSSYFCQTVQAYNSLRVSTPGG